jgi:hypothetical protein
MKMKTPPSRWDTAKAVVRGMLIPMSAYIKWTERSEINDLMLHLKLLEQKEQIFSQTSREVTKIRAKVNEIETTKPNQTKPNQNKPRNKNQKTKPNRNKKSTKQRAGSLKK